jgi:hypothetical protein
MANGTEPDATVRDDCGENPEKMARAVKSAVAGHDDIGRTAGRTPTVRRRRRARPIDESQPEAHTDGHE